MKLVAMQLLKGQTETITMMDLRSRLGDVVDQVQMGKAFSITKNGQVVAILSKPQPNAVQLGAAVRRLGLQGA